MKLGQWVAEVELLSQLIVLGDILCSLDLHVLLHPIDLVLQVYAQVLATVYPGKIVSTQF